MHSRKSREQQVIVRTLLNKADPFNLFHWDAAMALYSKHDRTYRKFVPSVARLSYHPVVREAGDAIARIFAIPFPELRNLPPNHLRIRVGAGNRILNNHVDFIHASSRCWLAFLSRGYCTSTSDVVELGCGCGRIARALNDPSWDPWFEGTYVGVDIDNEMLEYCRNNFPAPRFEFILSPHKSKTYSPNKSTLVPERQGDLVIAAPESKDFIYSISLYTHLLETDALDYLRETYRVLRADGTMYATFSCIEHVELGGRWTFQHRRGNAYIENPQYPEAAVAYHEAFMTELAIDCGFREVAIRSRGIFGELVARK
jgi:SAM-dependent methyltransferase